VKPINEPNLPDPEKIKTEDDLNPPAVKLLSLWRKTRPRFLRSLEKRGTLLYVIQATSNAREELVSSCLRTGATLEQATELADHDLINLPDLPRA
jgi:hypothetical protein